jgi:N-acetyl-gamma-glutamyl-phosphate reductase
MFHPHATIDFVFSTTNAGKPLHAHIMILGDIEMNFTDTVNPNECGFLVFRSWKIKIILEQNQFASHTKIIRFR